MPSAGSTVLRTSPRVSAGRLRIAGVDDHHDGKRAPIPDPLPMAPDNRFTMILKHRPQVAADAAGRFDLQLSGHTHRGQILPFNFIVARSFPMLAGYYPLADGSGVYTNRGTGTWGPQMRIGAPPEITLIELVGTQGASMKAR